MKIYLFNPETGAYLGEDFADEAPMGRGECVMPSGATAIAPPPFKGGEVPVFRAEENRWEIRPVIAEAAGGAGDPSEQADPQPKRHTFRPTF
ncbi:MAG TPA: hypothetical protein VI298_14110 [Geobacteraceae bacterium]